MELRRLKAIDEGFKARLERDKQQPRVARRRMSDSVVHEERKEEEARVMRAGNQQQNHNEVTEVEAINNGLN